MNSLHAGTLKKLDETFDATNKKLDELQDVIRAHSANVDKFSAQLSAQNAARTEQMNAQYVRFDHSTRPIWTVRFRHTRNRIHSNQLRAHSSRFGRNSRRPSYSTREAKAVWRGASAFDPMRTMALLTLLFSVILQLLLFPILSSKGQLYT